MLRGARSYFTSFSHFSYKVSPIINLHFTDEESKVSGNWAESGNLEYKSKRSNPETTVNHSFASDAFSGLTCREQGQQDVAWPGLCCCKNWEVWVGERAHPHHRRRPQRDTQRHKPTLALHLCGLWRKEAPSNCEMKKSHKISSTATGPQPEQNHMRTAQATSGTVKARK